MDDLCIFVILIIVFYVGGTTSTPIFTNKVHSSRYHKDKTLRTDSRNFVYGLYETWEWYDKCIKRKRNHGKKKNRLLLATLKLFYIIFS